MRDVDSRREEDEKRQVGEEMCSKEARRRAVERSRDVESYGDKESRRPVARRRG